MHKLKYLALVAILAVGLAGCWPAADNTGPRSSHTLGSANSGHYLDNCSTQDCSITDEHITGDVWVDGVAVTISDSFFDGNGTLDFAVKTVNGGSVSIQYTEFSNYLEAGIYESNWTCDYCDFHSMQGDGVKLGSNVTLTNSYFHDFNPSDGAHSDGAQLQAGGVENVVVAGNNFELGLDVNADIFLAANFGPGDGPVIIQANFFDGGNYSVYIVEGNSDPDYVIQDVNLKENHFLYGSYRYGALNVSSYVVGHDSSTPGINLYVCGNVWDDYTNTSAMATPYGDAC